MSTTTGANVAEMVPPFKFNEMKFRNAIRESLKELPIEPTATNGLYVAQDEALNELRKHERAIICAETGQGKTYVFLHEAARHDTAIVVVQDRGMQDQVANKARELGFNAIVGKGRAAFTCHLMPNQTCATGPCTMMDKTAAGRQRHECGMDCPFQRHKEEVLGSRGIIILNYGLVFIWLEHFNHTFICYDEIDSGLAMLNSKMVVDAPDSDILAWESAGGVMGVVDGYINYLSRQKIVLNEKMMVSRSQVDLLDIEADRKKLVAVLEKLRMFRTAKGCSGWWGEKKNHTPLYFLKGKMTFDDLPKSDQTYYSSATAYGNLPIIKWKIPTARRVVYAPYCDMTRRSFNVHPNLYAWQAEYIKRLYQICEEEGLFKGRLPTMLIQTHSQFHEEELFNVMGRSGDVWRKGQNKSDQCDFYLTSGVYKFCLVNGMERGHSYDDIAVQIILKCPYPNMTSPETLADIAYEISQGGSKDGYVEREMLTDMTQVLGRVGRGRSVGISIIVDYVNSPLVRALARSPEYVRGF